MGHNNIKRLIHRSFEEINSSIKIARKTSLSNLPIIFKGKLLCRSINKRGTAESKKETEILLKKHKITSEYFQKEFNEFIKNYRFNESSLKQNSNYKNKVWICWWQGLDNAPELVKRCVDSIKESSLGFEVVILDDNNYKEYVDIPEWLEDKKISGIISRTHFSDILRLELLSEHGGVWLDSTFFAKNLNVSEILSLPIWTIKRPDYGHLSVACGRFSNYSLACDFEHRKVFAIIRDYLFEYWRRNDSIVDYLFLDYLISLAISNNKEVFDLFENIPNNNPKCDDLIKVFGKEYDEIYWKELKQETTLFKLSWKEKFQEEVNNNITFYGKLLNKTL